MKEEIRVNEGRPVRCKKCGDLVKVRCTSACVRYRGVLSESLSR